jgi:hypothetical protein
LGGNIGNATKILGNLPDKAWRRTMTTTKTAALVLGLALAAFSARPAKAGIVVGQCIAGTQFKTIQEAVNAAPSGAVVKVCPGGYSEQITITKPVTLEGFISQGALGALILPPSTGFVQNDVSGYAAQILVENTAKVTITNLIVDAANNNLAVCHPNIIGILFHNASGTVNKMAVRNQFASNESSACDAYGVFALDDNQQAQTVTVENTDVRNSGYWGITGQGPGLTMSTVNNFVAGPSNALGFTAGIVYWLGAAGTIQGNTVVNEVLPNNTDPMNGSIGIAVACSKATVSGNTVSDTQTGIYVACPIASSYASNSTVTQNKVFFTKLGDAVYVGSSGNTITNNMLIGSTQSAIHFDATNGGTGNTATGNTITEGCSGILTSGTGSNKATSNTFNNVFTNVLNATGCQIL